MSEPIQNFKTIFNDCDIVHIDKKISAEELTTYYFSLLEEGKMEKFHPIIVTVDEILLEKFELDLEDENLEFSNKGMALLRTKILEKYQTIDAKNYYHKEKEEIKGELEDIDFEEPDDDEVLFVSCLNKNEQLHDNVVILKIPTEKPYEALSWLPIGGFNDCPTPELMTAIAKYWHETYGAVPCAISHDVVEFYVPNPPEDKEQLCDLGLEQFLFDIDIVEQGVGDVESLIETLYKNKQWYFWWD